MSFFQFQNPAFLALLALLPVLAWLRGQKGPDGALRFSTTAVARLVGRHRQSHVGRFLATLRLLALACLIFALARPQIGHLNDTREASGIDIVVTLDLSGSMRALDLSTREDVVTRLDAAKRVVQDFIDQREYDRIGIVAFGTDAYVVSPLTLNHDWLKRNVDRLELGDIDGNGTAIGTALGASVNRLRDHPGRSRIVILLTDGENNAGQLSPLGAAETAKTYGVKAYTIATGKKGRVPVPETTSDGRVLRNAEGRPIYRGRSDISNFDETDLREIAAMTGGRFFSATKDGDLEKIYAEIDALEKTTIELKSYATLNEYFAWPAIAGLIFLGTEILLGSTVYRRIP